MSAYPKCDLTLIIACYNEVPHLAGSVAAIEAVMATTNYTYETLFIEDCSTDGTAAVVRDLQQRPLAPGCVATRAIYHEQNVGRGGTVKEGVEASGSTYVGFLDIDLEVGAQFIPLMLTALEEGIDVATAMRESKAGWSANSIVRFILSWGYRGVFHALLRSPLRDTETGYKFFRREEILPALAETKNNGWFWDTEIMVLAWLNGLSIREIPCPFIRREEKASTVRIFQDVPAYLRALLKFRRQVAGRRPKVDECSVQVGP
ncbi:MAG: glycosyltransferase involved in cell wall biosynthesis [Bacteroidia bacterium]|jgi:glycosyltransferase involved in cell wall biosynthesis